MEKLFAVIENNTVVNVVINLDNDLVLSNPDKYIEYTNGWNYDSGIDGGIFFPISSPLEESGEQI